MKRRTVRKREPTARRVRRKTGRALAAFRRRVAQGTLTAEDRAAIKRGEVKTTAEMVAVGFPAGGPTRKQFRGWSAREFLEWKRQDRQQTGALAAHASGGRRHSGVHGTPAAAATATAFGWPCAGQPPPHQ